MNHPSTALLYRSLLMALAVAVLTGTGCRKIPDGQVKTQEVSKGIVTTDTSQGDTPQKSIAGHSYYYGGGTNTLNTRSMFFIY